MSAELFSFPSPARAPAPASGHAGAVRRAPLRTRRRYGFADMVRHFGLEDYEPRTQVDHLRALHCQAGLPLPLNPRFHKGRLQQGAASIGQRSVWCAIEVDDFRDGRRHAAPAPDEAAPPLPPPVRRDCAQRARQLARAG